MPSKKYTIVQIALLATAFKKSTQTIERWIKSNDDRLTSDKATAALLLSAMVVATNKNSKKKK